MQVPIDQIIATFRALATPKREDPPAETPAQPVERVNPTRLTRSASDGNQIDREELARERWARKALDDELWQFSRSNKGNRNDSLNKAAFALGQSVGGGLLSEQEVQSSLTAIGQQIGLGKEEILPTVLSGLAAGKKKPCTPPPLALSGAGRGGNFRFGSGATTPPPGQPPSSEPALALVPKKPLIVINGRQEQEIIEDALDAPLAANTPEYLFVRSATWYVSNAMKTHALT